MTHIWGHIECGSVGTLVGHDEGRVWPFVNKFIVAFKLFGPAAEDKKLEKRIIRIMEDMAEFVQGFHGGEIHPLEMIDGDYCAIILGDKLGEIPMEPLPIHTDALFTYAVNLVGMPHAVQSYIINELDTWRYQVYSAVYQVTGGEIHRNSYAA